MRRFWILATLACGTLAFGGCGGSNTQTADNSSSSNEASESSRPSRKQGGGDSSGSSKSGASRPGASQSGGSGSNEQMSGDPERRNGQDPSMNGQGSMGDMADQMAKMREQREGGGAGARGGGGGEPKKPDHIPQQEWDDMSSSAKQRAGSLQAGGGGNRAGGNPGGNSGGRGPGGGDQMSGDPRMRNGKFNSDESSGNDEQMDGDPRMRNGGNTGSGNGGQNEQMDGDPRMRNGGGGGGAGSAMAPGGGAGSASAPGGGFSGPGGPGGGFNGPGNGMADAAPKTLKDKSIRSFQDGDDDGGFQYMYGHFIAEDEGRSRIALQMLPTVRRPRTAMRWGIGVVMKQNKGFSGDPPKIGEQPNVLPQGRNSSRGGRGGFGQRGGNGGAGGFAGGSPGMAGGSSQMGNNGGGFGNRGGGGNPANGGMDELKYYTGEVGETLVGMLEKLRTRGHFGKMIAKISQGDGGSNNGRNNFAGNFSGGAGGSPTIDDGRSAADRNRFRSGGGAGGSRPGRPKPQGDSPASAYKNVLPGVLMLGKSSLKGLQSRAKARGIDVLVVFEVNCKLVPSNGQKINETKVSLYDVAKGTRVGKPSSTLSNIRVWMARQKNQDEDSDPVRSAVKSIFESGKEDGFLATYKVADMPELNQGQVMNRLNSLIPEGQASGNPLPAIVELTFYREKGLLPEKAYVDSVNKLAGSDIGETLLNGAESERVKALAALLPPEWRVQESAGGDADDDDIL